MILLPSNENPLGMPASASAAAAQALGDAGSYPDGSATVLKQALSTSLGVRPTG